MRQALSLFLGLSKGYNSLKLALKLCCSIAGRPSTTVTIASIDTTAVGSDLSAASISCTGGSKNITIQGGPALESYSGNWKGK